VTGQLRVARILAAAAVVCGAVTAGAQEAPESLKVYFASGSASVATDQAATLDQAARLFRDGNPIVMIVAGVADTVGPADGNLALSVARAESVAQGLAGRGIPAGRLQVHGRGNSELEVDTGDDVAEPENRIVEITWR
jgi:outer membrane protein OmpA-like peptidoglycan-associated protein